MLGEEIVEEELSFEVADLYLQMLFKVPPNGADSSFSSVVRDGDGGLAAHVDLESGILHVRDGHLDEGNEHRAHLLELIGDEPQIVGQPVVHVLSGGRRHAEARRGLNFGGRCPLLQLNQRPLGDLLPLHPLVLDRGFQLVDQSEIGVHRLKVLRIRLA